MTRSFLVAGALAPVADQNLGEPDRTGAALRDGGHPQFERGVLATARFGLLPSASSINRQSFALGVRNAFAESVPVRLELLSDRWRVHDSGCPKAIRDEVSPTQIGILLIQLL